MTLNELRESVKAGNGIRGADALAAEQVRELVQVPLLEAE